MKKIQLYDNKGNKVYPRAYTHIGQLIITKSKTYNPNEDYEGTTWELVSKGMAIVGVDSSDTHFNEAGKTYGEKEHKLTTNEMPSHNHETSKYWYSAEGGNGFMGSNATGSTASNSNGISATGGNQPHNNIQPSMAFYIWCRIA